MVQNPDAIRAPTKPEHNAMRVVTTVPQHSLRATRVAAADIEARGFDGLCSLEKIGRAHV